MSSGTRAGDKETLTLYFRHLSVIGTFYKDYVTTVNKKNKRLVKGKKLKEEEKEEEKEESESRVT